MLMKVSCVYHSGQWWLSNLPPQSAVVYAVQCFICYCSIHMWQCRLHEYHEQWIIHSAKEWDPRHPPQLNTRAPSSEQHLVRSSESRNKLTPQAEGITAKPPPHSQESDNSGFLWIYSRKWKGEENRVQNILLNGKGKWFGQREIVNCI